MILEVYKHSKKDKYNRFVYDYSKACGLDGVMTRSILKRDNEDDAIRTLKDHIASLRKTTNFTIKIVIKDFVVY